MVYENPRFTESVNVYISRCRKVREKAQKYYEKIRHNQKKVYFVQFEEFVLSEDYRNSLAEIVGLDFANQQKHKYFQPWVSEKNVFLHEAYENQDEIKIIEKNLKDYCVDVHRLKNIDLYE